MGFNGVLSYWAGYFGPKEKAPKTAILWGFLLVQNDLLTLGLEQRLKAKTTQRQANSK
jgi:hypothetical protein